MRLTQSLEMHLFFSRCADSLTTTVSTAQPPILDLPGSPGAFFPFLFSLYHALKNPRTDRHSD